MNRSTKNVLKSWLIIGFIIGVVVMGGCNIRSGVNKNASGQYFPVLTADGSGIMDCSGEWIVESLDIEEVLISDLMVNGLAPVINIGDDYYTYVNQEGEFPFDQQFEMTMPFSEGLAAVKVAGKWGFIDPTGKLVIKPQYLSVEIGRYNNGLANVAVEEHEMGFASSWIFINQDGEQVLGPYPRVGSFSDGYAAVWGLSEGEERVSGFINTEGDLVLELTQEDRLVPAGEYSEGLFPVKDAEKQIKEGVCSIGFMNKDKAWVIDPQYCEVGPFRNGLAPVSRSVDPLMKNSGYINTAGEVVIEEQYDFASPFLSGCALVRWDNHRASGLIDTQGEFIYQHDLEN